MESRQVRRAYERREKKITAATARMVSRKLARRALLERQTRRENDGSYEGRPSVASVITPSRSRITERKVKKGQPFGRFLTENYHATKGWRVR